MKAGSVLILGLTLVAPFGVAGAPRTELPNQAGLFDPWLCKWFHVRCPPAAPEPPTRPPTPPPTSTRRPTSTSTAKPQTTSTGRTTTATSQPTAVPAPAPGDNDGADDGFDPTTEIPALARLEKRWGTFERRFTALPSEGLSTQIPWASSYWPSFLDGINNRWQGSRVPSPVEKYATAYGLDASKLAAEYSKQHGVLMNGHISHKCVSSFGCPSGSKCVAPSGAGVFEQRYCVPTWEGICDGWTAAAVLLPEPKCSVRAQNGVIFNPGDLKALMSGFFAADRGKYTYDIGMSARCRTDTPRKDPSGYYTDNSCNDSSAGMFHLVITNMLGRYKRAFAFDQETEAEVWNQPVYGFKMQGAAEITRAYAQQILGADFKLGPHAAKFIHVASDLDWVSEATDSQLDLNYEDNARQLKSVLRTTRYEYILVLNADGIIVGGEWVGKSKNNQPDFMWFPYGTDKTAVVYGGIAYAELDKLWQKSATCSR
ncbi:uncharacterized protein EV422DRAFT_120810 [Fimicolochytrium jonesii]|uniref:uncharacterized protein n=1 Tax=Fimicolochytrium jonesii TaxID=1396493 RepID=UPI0022FDF99D|nr:uncharacterized protein EV422DRAFT_120810 [Fimicolochytrium jonesii]KAI8819188.1 hypothetical protein EV422DRAFT_120810 [Fimicolochytrium jonesii]